MDFLNDMFTMDVQSLGNPESVSRGTPTDPSLDTSNNDSLWYQSGNYMKSRVPYAGDTSGFTLGPWGTSNGLQRGSKPGDGIFTDKNGNMFHKRDSDAYYQIIPHDNPSALERYGIPLAAAAFTGGIGGGLGGSSAMAGGLSGAFGGGLAGSAAAGAFGAGLTGGDPLRGGLVGGALSFAPDVSGYAGVTDPVYRGVLNGGVKGAIGGAITGGKAGIAGGAITGGIMGGLHGYDVSQSHYSPTDSRQALLNDITQTSSVPSAGGYKSAMSADVNQSFAPAYTSNGSYNAPEMQTPSESNWASPDLGALMGKILPQSARGWGDLAQGALGMYGAYKQRKMARDLQSQIGGNRKAYQTQLTRDLQRRDAASGRRSNYAGRATELQSSLAQLDYRNAPALAQLQQAELGGLVNMFQTGLRYGDKAGWFGSPDTQQPLYLPSLIGQQQGPQDYSVDQQRKIKLGGYGG